MNFFLQIIYGPLYKKYSRCSKNTKDTTTTNNAVLSEPTMCKIPLFSTLFMFFCNFQFI